MQTYLRLSNAHSRISSPDGGCMQVYVRATSILKALSVSHQKLHITCDHSVPEGLTSVMKNAF